MLFKPHPAWPETLPRMGHLPVSVCGALRDGLSSQVCEGACGHSQELRHSPRGLALQIKGMKDRLEFWCTDVRSMEMLVEHQAHDILT